MCALNLGACSWLTTSVSKDFGGQFSATVANSNDPQTVAQALPTYLITLDTLLSDSDSSSLFWAGAKLNGLYGGQFVDNGWQKKKLLDKSWDYGQRAICLQDKAWCGVATFSHTELQALLDQADEEDVASLYSLGSVWAGWIEANSGDWNAVAKIGQVQMLMEKVVVLDDGYDQGAAHLYLGVLFTLVPPAMGGKPELGREHFEKAIELSQGKNLIAKVFYAKNYARLVFDQELHDRLLREVLAADPEQTGFTLANTLAQEQARQLLAGSNGYF